MFLRLAGVALLASIPSTLQSGTPDCSRFQELVRTTYDFRPADLNSQQQRERGMDMTRFWERVEAAPGKFVPCLRTALLEPDANPWFLCDGSALLAKVDPTKESKALQTKVWANASFKDLAFQPWMALMTERGAEGFDTSIAIHRWLSTKDAEFVVVEHALTVDAAYGAIFLAGSMSEDLATPALVEIASTQKHLGRETAIQLLTLQATAASREALRKIDLSGLPQQSAEYIKTYLSKPDLLKGKSPRSGTSRKKFIAAFEAQLNGDISKLAKIMTSDDEWPARALKALKAEDMPLLRRVRRWRLRTQSDEALYEYMMYTAILQAAVVAAER